MKRKVTDMPEHRIAFVPAEKAGERIDRYLAVIWGMSRSGIQRLLDDQVICVNGEPASKNQRLRDGDLIAAEIPDPAAGNVEAEDIPLDIFFEDADLLVVNKPKGMVVHPAPGHSSGTLVNALLHHCGDSLSGVGGVIRPGIVHRIDKDTSGLLLVAKNDRIHQRLAHQISTHTLKREYEAVAVGRFKEPDGTVNSPIGRHRSDRKKMAVTPEGKGGRFAVTHYRVLAEYAWKNQIYSHIACRLETGRTHQIRVHMSSLGHPLAGDTVYGGGDIPFLAGQCLHAKTIGFRHPRTRMFMEFTSELPDYFTGFLKKMDLRETMTYKENL